MEGKPANRALTKSSQWSHEDADRQILVPYSYHASSAKYHAEIDAAMSAMNRDLGCINIVKVPHSKGFQMIKSLNFKYETNHVTGFSNPVEPLTQKTSNRICEYCAD
jgi:hypothetical protein